MRPTRPIEALASETHDLRQKRQLSFFQRQPDLCEQGGEVLAQIRPEIRLVEADGEKFQHLVEIGGIAGLDRIRQH